MKIAKAAQAAGKNVQPGKKHFFSCNSKDLTTSCLVYPRRLPRALSLGLAHISHRDLMGKRCRSHKTLRGAEMLKKAGQLTELCRSAGPKIRTLNREMGLRPASSAVSCVSRCKSVPPDLDPQL